VLAGDSGHDTRFAFIEYTNATCAQRAMSLSATRLGKNAIRYARALSLSHIHTTRLHLHVLLLDLTAARVCNSVSASKTPIYAPPRDDELFPQGAFLALCSLLGRERNSIPTCLPTCLPAYVRLGVGNVDDLGQKRKRDDEDPSDPKRRRTEEELDESPHVSHLKSSTRSDDGGGAL